MKVWGTAGPPSDDTRLVYAIHGGLRPGMVGGHMLRIFPGVARRGARCPSSGSESDGPSERMFRACEKMDCPFRGRVPVSEVVETGDAA